MTEWRTRTSLLPTWISQAALLEAKLRPFRPFTSSAYFPAGCQTSPSFPRAREHQPDAKNKPLLRDPLWSCVCVYTGREGALQLTEKTAAD